MSQVVPKVITTDVRQGVDSEEFRQRSVSRRERLVEALANLLILVGRQGLEPWTR